ncbi:MAG TPA: thioredoxin-disulfide reductase [Miltoncostaeaceae bacterium]|nr:thioredoxin-disulfide reductase [Miltoncostaeaceae bacterium]
MPPKTRKVIIIGSGPAGLTAAVYAARANLEPLMFEGYGWGGQLMLTTEVENYPGFPMGVMGPELMQAFRDQAERFGTEIVPADVTRVDLSSRPFGVWVDDEEYRAEAIVISTGASARWLGLESETSLRGHGVSSCATCDGFFFRDKPMVVVGGGDSAMEEALYLARIGSKVTIVHRRDAFRASKIMVDRALANDRVHVRWNAVVEEVVGDGRVEGVRVRDVVTGETETIPAAAMFVAIGHTPNTELFRGQLELDPDGYIVADGSRTNVEGVFVAGDVQDRQYKQAVTAAGSGCIAAIDAERWLELGQALETDQARTASAATGN